MNIREIVLYNILKRLDEIVNSSEFKEKYQDIKPGEYLYVKVHKKIRLKRLIDILGNRAENITLREIDYIATALNVPLYALFENRIGGE